MRKFRIGRLAAWLSLPVAGLLALSSCRPGAETAGLSSEVSVAARLSAQPPATLRVEGRDVLLRFFETVDLWLPLDAPAALVLEGLEPTGGWGALQIDVAAEGAEGSRHWVLPWHGSVSVELPAAPAVHVRLAARGLGGGVWARDLRVLAASPVRTWSDRFTPARGERSVPARRYNVILYIVDTLRADHLGIYGYPRGTSPRLDAFAEDALVFERAVAQSSWTRTAMASVVTGLRPSTHGVSGRDDALADEALTLAEVLDEAGWKTAAFIANANAGAHYGFDQGFQRFEQLPQRDDAHFHAMSDAVTRAGLDWLAGLEPGAPFFLHLHTVDPHAPYSPLPEIGNRFASDAAREGPAPSAPRDEKELAALLAHNRSLPDQARNFELGSKPFVQALRKNLIPVDDAVIRDLISLYDAEIYQNDLAFGALVDGVRELGLWDDTLLVFVSDHGEEFYDHQGWSHGRTLYQEQLHVPLVIRVPGMAGGRTTRPARQVDIVPTVLGALGLPVPDTVEGIDLLATPAEATPACADLDLGGKYARSLSFERWKLLCEGADARDCELFDLEADPTEQQDRSEELPIYAAYLRSGLEGCKGGSTLRAEAEELDEELREQLRALGYAH